MATVITALPPVPSRSNAPDLFADRADAFLGALPTFREELNALGAEIEGAGGDAAAQVALAEAQVALATAQADIATTQAGLALTRAGDANTSAVAAGISAGEALTHANDAEAALASFELKYLGSKSADPTLDNSGNPLVEGQIYWHSTANELRFYNGSTWTTANLVPADYLIKAGDTMTGPLIITNTSTNNSFVVEDQSSDTTPFIIDNSGKVVMGGGSARLSGTVSANVQVNGDGTAPAGFAGFGWADSATFNPRLEFAKSRSGIVGTHTVVQSNDTLGSIGFTGSDGTAFTLSSLISAQVDGTPGPSDMPGRLVFSTTADGASSPSERMRITSSGRVGIGNTSINNRFEVQGGGSTFSRNTGNYAAPPTMELVNFSGVSTNSTYTPQVSFHSDRSDRYSAIGHYRGATSSDIGLSISVDSGSGTQVEAMRIQAGGNIGLGIAPVTKLDINGNQSSNIVTLSVGVGALDCSLGNFFKTSVTTGTLTFSFSNVPASRAFSVTVEVTHTAGTIAFPASVSFPNSGTAPTLTAGKRHVLGFITSNGGTTWSLVSSTNYNT